MCCCCPSAKFRRPEFGNDNYERAATILTVILFLLVFPELIAYATLTDVYIKGDSVSCCGMIKEKSSSLVEAPCKEKNFPDSAPKIAMEEIDGIVYCKVNDLICDVFYWDDGSNTTMAECLADSDQGFNITQMCSPELLATSDPLGLGYAYGILTFIFGFITAAVAFCDFFGCFREMCLCQSRIYQGFNKIIEIFCWLCFLFISKVFIENPAQNGYSNNSLVDSEAYEYFDDHCGNNPVWNELQLDVPEWVISDGFDAIGWIGLALSIVDFILFFVIICGCKDCRKSSNESNEVEMQTSKQIKTAQQKETTNVATELAAV